MGMYIRTWQLIVIVIVLSIIAGVLLQMSPQTVQWMPQQPQAVAAGSYDECAAAGYPILESYPTQCRTPDGQTFVNPHQRVGPPSDAFPPAPGAREGCVIGGCSGEICSEAADGPMASNCIYREEFGCYKQAVCERQGDGRCGWTQTAALQSCIRDARTSAPAGGPQVY